MHENSVTHGKDIAYFSGAKKFVTIADKHLAMISEIGHFLVQNLISMRLNSLDDSDSNDKKRKLIALQNH